MGSFSLTHWLVVALVVLVLFGRGRISEVMGDFGKGIRSFRTGLADDGNESVPAAKHDIEPKRLSGAECALSEDGKNGT